MTDTLQDIKVKRAKQARIAYLTLALHELQVIAGERPASDDIANAIEDTRKELDALQAVRTPYNLLDHYKEWMGK